MSAAKSLTTAVNAAMIAMWTMTSMHVVTEFFWHYFDAVKWFIPLRQHADGQTWARVRMKCQPVVEVAELTHQVSLGTLVVICPSVPKQAAHHIWGFKSTVTAVCSQDCFTVFQHRVSIKCNTFFPATLAIQAAAWIIGSIITDVVELLSKLSKV